MSNKYLPNTEYEPKGLIYKLPLGIGDAFKDAIIPESFQEAQLAKQNENKLQADAVSRNLNDNLLIDMRADGLLGADYQPIESENLSFGANLLSVNKEGNQFTPKYNDYIEALFGDFPLLTKTQTVNGTVEDFKPTRVVYNQKNNSVFLVGENYKGEMAPKTLMSSDAKNDQIAEYSMSDFNELARIAFESKYIGSNQRPGYLSNAVEDVNNMADNFYTEIAMGIKEAAEQGLIDDPDILNQFNEGIAALVAGQQDEEKSKQLDDQLPPIALTEMRPEIVELLPDQAESPESGSEQAEATIDASTLEPGVLDKAMTAWNNMTPTEKAGMLSTGLIFIPGVGAVGIAALRGIALTANALSKVKFSKKFIDFAQKFVTKPKKELKAITKSGKRIDPKSPQGQAVLQAGEADMKKRSTMEKVGDFGKGKLNQNPRTVTEKVKDDAGNVVREFSPIRAGSTGSVAAGVSGNVAIGQIERELDEIADTGTPETTATTEEVVNIPTFTSPQDAVTYFQNEDNYNNFIKAATSKGAQDAAQKLEDAFETLGVTDAQSFSTNIEEIKRMINPQNDLNVNKQLAVVIAERSGAPKETQATLFNDTLSTLTGADRLGFEVAKERRSIQTADIEDFTNYYLKDFNTSEEFQEITDLFITNEDGTSFDDLSGQMLLQRQKFAGKYPELFPEYQMTPRGPVNIKRAQVLANAARRGLSQANMDKLRNNLKQIEKLERTQTSNTVRKLIEKYSGTGPIEAIRNWAAGRGGFADPEDEIFPYIQVEVNQRGDQYDPVRFIIRQPGSGARSSVVIEDQEFVAEFGNLDSAYQMSFYANLPPQNIKVLNKK